MRLIKGAFEQGEIKCDASSEDIYQAVMKEGVLILKGVFQSTEMERLRNLVFQWGKSADSTPQQEFYDNKTRNHFCIEKGVSKGQKTLHYFHSYNFNSPQQGLPEDLEKSLITYGGALRDLYNAVTRSAASLHRSDGKQLHAQVIRYPAGGGHFARHIHPLEPQKIGFITSLTQRGKDFERGGAGFDIGGELIDIEDVHDVGDIALFRYDLPHWVSPVDIEERMDPDSLSGRWSLIIPHY